jgi:hypothetical protein
MDPYLEALSPSDIQQLEAAEAEVWQELRRVNPVSIRFSYVLFVSRSKGRGRKRKRLKGRGPNRRRKSLTEIELIEDTLGRPGRFRLFDRFPFDTTATEVFPFMDDGLAAEARLRKEIPIYGRR